MSLKPEQFCERVFGLLGSLLRCTLLRYGGLLCGSGLLGCCRCPLTLTQCLLELGLRLVPFFPIARPAEQLEVPGQIASALGECLYVQHVHGQPTLASRTSLPLPFVIEFLVLLVKPRPSSLLLGFLEHSAEYHRGPCSECRQSVSGGALTSNALEPTMNPQQNRRLCRPVAEVFPAPGHFL